MKKRVIKGSETEYTRNIRISKKRIREQYTWRLDRTGHGSIFSGTVLVLKWNTTQIERVIKSAQMLYKIHTHQTERSLVS